MGIASGASFVCAATVELLMAVATKRLLCPRFEGRSPMWSCKFIAWEVFTEVLAMLGATVLPYIQGTPLMPWWLWALGATVGRGVYFDTLPPTETDCLVIED